MAEMVVEKDDMTVAFCVVICCDVSMRSLLERAEAVALLLSSAVAVKIEEGESESESVREAIITTDHHCNYSYNTIK